MPPRHTPCCLPCLVAVRYVSRVWLLVRVLQNESSRVRGTGIRNPRAAGQAGAPDGGMAVATR